MQVTPTTLNTIPQINEYNLEGGVVIRDKTNGIGKAIFSSELTEKHKTSVYQVFINNKKLVYPTCSDPGSSMNILFGGSLNITFKQKGEFIKITEKDESSKSVFYVDFNKPINKIAYAAYTYIPKEITEEDAMQKVESLRRDFPNFEGEIAIYNRHGVAVFGCDGNNYALYWAGPHQDKITKIECSICARYRDGGTSIAKSKDESVHFQYFFDDFSYYLNAETAKHISLAK